MSSRKTIETLCTAVLSSKILLYIKTLLVSDPGASRNILMYKMLRSYIVEEIKRYTKQSNILSFCGIFTEI